ncbi:cytochrome c oxidase subunit II [Rhizobium sp. SAFR-030]|uniref:cytochrome c oxidase subunit II n=1 Tax=Rhizobium sp. SAFR-030 TaxID=3387277 RepID=UPI003F7D66BE
MHDDRLTGVCRPIRSPVTRWKSRLSAAAFLSVSLSSCSGVQSALDPAGSEASAVATLFWVMVVGGGVIWLGVIGLMIYASRKSRSLMGEAGASKVIFFGGVAFPVVVLAGLLSYAVWLMPAMRPWFGGEGEGLRRIEVTGEQFWWRVRYLDTSGKVIRESANEVRMPVGERVLFRLKASDVIHSFWIPSIGGKMDAIPGRINELQLMATKPGSYRGVCAEFCGTSHALMAFTVQAMPASELDAWLAAAPAPAVSPNPGGPAPADPAPGLALFLRHGCAACHAIDGTEAEGRIGPDLTRFGQRPTIGAGTLPNTHENLVRFIRAPDQIKPNVRMPAYGMLPEDELAAIAEYLRGLE